MTKVRILGPIDEGTRAALVALLGEAGFEVVEDDCAEVISEAEQDEEAEPALVDNELEAGSAEPSENTPANSERDACIVVIAPDCANDPSFTKQVQSAAGCGCKVVGIWPPGTVAGQRPQAIEDYGFGTVIWDKDRLRDALDPANKSPDWSEPDGQPRTPPKIKRNRC